MEKSPGKGPPRSRDRPDPRTLFVSAFSGPLRRFERHQSLSVDYLNITTFFNIATLDAWFEELELSW